MKRKLWIASGALVLIIASIVIVRSCFLKDPKIGLPIDSFNGVIVYYNGPVSNVSGRNLAKDGYNIGQKYQCVEFVKRYYYEYYHHKMPDSYNHARDFFDDALADGEINKKRALVQYRNPSRSQPKVGDLVILGGHVANRYGHVAIVSEVNENEIEIIQQNPGMYENSRVRIALKRQDGAWFVDNGRTLGWLRKEG